MKINLVIAVLVVSLIKYATASELPAPLPEFKSPAQLKMNAKLHPNSGNIQQSTANGSFYTGKPYDNTNNAYLFKGRTYDSALARWTSLDPSGFPDGANNAIYAPHPLSQLDPTGLDTVDVSWTPHSGPSGGIFSFTVSPPDAHPITPDATMIVSWHVNSSYSGWLVQHVTFDLTGIYNDSDNSQYTNGPTTYDYWEAWEVTNGSISPASTDQYTLAYPSSTHGTASITGQVDFFQSSVFASLTGNNNPANWSTGVSGAEPAGILQATTTAPSFWSDSGYNHNMSMTWE